MKIAKRNNPFKIDVLKLRRGDTLVVYSDDICDEGGHFVSGLRRLYPFLKDVILLPADSKLSVIQQ